MTESRGDNATTVDAATAVLIIAIGARVRDARRARRWTLYQLASASGLGRRTLVRIEQGDVNPSLGVLLRVSLALDLDLPTLVTPPTQVPAQVRQRHHPVRTGRAGIGQK